MNIVLKYDSDGTIVRWRPEGTPDLNPELDELTVSRGAIDLECLHIFRIDDTGPSPVVVERPDSHLYHHGVLTPSEALALRFEYREAGTDAIAAHDAIDANANIPQEVVDRSEASLRMFYLLYVSLTGDRIQSVEDRFFSG